MNTIRILGVTVHNVSAAAVAEFFGTALAQRAQATVYTPNPEILLHAHRNPSYAQVLNTAALALPDGRGLRIVRGLQHTVTGANAAHTLLQLANAQHKTVTCIVRADGRSTAQQVHTAVQQLAPQATVHVVLVAKNAWQDTSLVAAINSQQPHILLVGLGFPQQEYWIHQHLQGIPSARIAMAVGGTFDFWTGTAKRAPQWMQGIGLEWLWRLLQQPRRIKRIFNAVVVFPLTYLQNK